MRTPCPVCSGILLRHLTQNRILWFCLGCHQEMPNFDLVKLGAIQEKFIQFDNYIDERESICRTYRAKNSIVANRKSTVIDVFIDVDRKRLEVVSFIMNKINIIMSNAFTETEQYLVDKKKPLDRLDVRQIKASTLIKVDFIRDSKILLLYICQAILLADSTILNSANLQKLKVNSISLKLPIEQSYFIDIIKTLVVSFINSITFDSERSLDYFATEVASYFEMTIELIIKLQ